MVFPDDASTLSDNFVSTLYKDASGQLWVGTRNGLNRLDRSTGAFVRYQHDPGAPQSLGEAWVVATHQSTGFQWGGEVDAAGLVTEQSVIKAINPVASRQ